MVPLETLAVAFVVAATGCVAGTDVPSDLPLRRGEERTVDGLIDGDSALWDAAPFLHEVPRECPIPDAVPTVPMLHWVYVVELMDAAAVDVSLEGSSFDPSLTGEPELLVYAGAVLPTTATAARNCLGAAKPGGGRPGVVTDVAVPAGQALTIVAHTEGAPGFPGGNAGTFRVRITAR